MLPSLLIEMTENQGGSCEACKRKKCKVSAPALPSSPKTARTQLNPVYSVIVNCKKLPLSSVLHVTLPNETVT